MLKNWSKGFCDNSEDLPRCHCSLFQDFEKYSLKNENSEDVALLKKILELIENELVISSSKKMKPSLNPPKARQTIPDGSLKKQEPSKKYLKSKMKSSNSSEINEPQEKPYSGVKKVKQHYSEILFLKNRSLPSELAKRELTSKKKQLELTLKLLNQTFSPTKI